MRSLRPRQARHHRGQVQFVHGGEGGILLARGEVSQHANSFHVFLNISNHLGISAGLSQVVQAPAVHREEPHGSPILWAHVGDGGSVCNAQLGHSWPEKLDELAHDPHLPQVLGDGEYHVSGGDMGSRTPCDLVTNYLGKDHGDWLAKHHGLCLNTTTTTPPKPPQPPPPTPIQPEVTPSRVRLFRVSIDDGKKRRQDSRVISGLTDGRTNGSLFETEKETEREREIKRE